ncbi:Clp protease ClpP [Burkholderia multivorans]|uniref:ATP-dependent Clp protease proteolytic subunit n=1 Tax=Burkholderia multivorans (strain ATCC 17616 / 249) TaxID=395019 RepID=A0A0H3KMM3_BURM1|nr:head maturation protease, ClpP-related [Burkholderia multivorans]YP_355413.1 head maturation protease [Burkholderia phage Bcep176]ABA60079.1 gp77 [Burkholderia phage Bcep176]ABX17549.1 peptidase S14 ClpP [Burkholderia multivorans ATCC 17616]PRF62508.1 Clp protease ClpP [Burkholderia multivorans]UQN71745.1 Clp protease ClpP [Burkholderia multivorans]UQN77482.1 Clp protease ClpP [Burkholderia multivorans]
MSLLQLPEIRADHRLGAAQFDVRPDALERWNPDVRAANADDAAAISIYDSIGDNWEGTGVTAKRISAALRNIGAREVTVNVNSPGGDFFEGVAIYNLLREHKAKVTVNVMGLAASAASVIAMAGDEILMGDGAFLMIHNAWAVAIGNRHDMAAAAATLAPFDAAMAKLYAQRAGISEETAAAMMDKETWIGADQAVKDGFATGKLDSAPIAMDTNTSSGRKAMALIEASMARAGYSRSMRRDALKALFDGKPGATAGNATPGAGEDVAASLHTLINALKG